MYYLIIKDKVLIFEEETDELIEQYELDDKSICGNIYKARVTRVVKGLDSCFVDIGEGKNALLRTSKYKANTPVIVQVKKEPHENKGAIVSDKIQLAGKYVILLPTENYVSVSNKITNEGEIIRLKNLVQTNFPGYGLIIRTSAQNENEKIISEINELYKQWEKINCYNGDIPKLLYQENVIKKIFSGLTEKNISKIITERTDEIKKILKELKLNIPIENKNIEVKVPDITKRTVWLKSGASIKIDVTEALTAIDVNSGSYVGKSELEETAIKINKEATIEIAKQIRLRNLRGIIIIDYINLESEIAKQEIVNLMRTEVMKDRSKVEVLGFTKLGLVEMTRKKM